MPRKTIKLVLILSLILLISSTTVFAVKLELDDQGEEVKKVQNLLFQIGYDIKVDGDFGYRTLEIVKDFQVSNGLTVDGVVGDETLAHLQEMAKDIKYTVQTGDSLSEIAVKFDTTIKELKRRNNLNNDIIIIGQELSIPKTGLGGGEETGINANIIHEVQRGDALSVLAKKYGSDIETIKLANTLRSDQIYIGQNLVIPHISRGSNQPFKLSRGSIIWPVLGRISSAYGWRIHPISNKREFHSGLDIAVPLGTRIRAAAAGTVTQSGWVNGFGKTIVIDHGTGIQTLYGHNSRLLIPAGTRVHLGEVIALAGSTGRSTGSHLHFGIIANKRTVNPRSFLP